MTCENYTAGDDVLFVVGLAIRTRSVPTCNKIIYKIEYLGSML